MKLKPCRAGSDWLFVVKGVQAVFVEGVNYTTEVHNDADVEVRISWTVPGGDQLLVVCHGAECVVRPPVSTSVDWSPFRMRVRVPSVSDIVVGSRGK